MTDPIGRTPASANAASAAEHPWPITLSLRGLTKGEVLVTLFEAAREDPSHLYPDALDPAQAEQLLATKTVFTLLHGRQLFIDLSDDTLDVDKFNACNGPGAAQHAIAALRREKEATGSPLPADTGGYMVRLSKGGLVSRVDLKGITDNLQIVFKLEPRAARDLRERCRNPEAPFHEDNERFLREAGLIKANGTVDETTRLVVLSCLQGEGLDFGYVSPFGK